MRLPYTAHSLQRRKADMGATTADAGYPVDPEAAQKPHGWQSLLQGEMYLPTLQ